VFPSSSVTRGLSSAGVIYDIGSLFHLHYAQFRMGVKRQRGQVGVFRGVEIPDRWRRVGLRGQAGAQAERQRGSYNRPADDGFHSSQGLLSSVDCLLLTVLAAFVLRGRGPPPPALKKKGASLTHFLWGHGQAASQEARQDVRFARASRRALEEKHLAVFQRSPSPRTAKTHTKSTALAFGFM